MKQEHESLESSDSVQYNQGCQGDPERQLDNPRKNVASNVAHQSDLIDRRKKNERQKKKESETVGAQLYRNRRTSSSVCKAGALVSSSSCLDGEPHGWVPVDTHSTPVPSSTGEAVGGPMYRTSPINHRKMRNPYMVAEQEFRSTTPEPASQLSSETVSRTAPPGSESSEDDENSTPSMEQSEETAPATPSLTTTK